MHERTHTRAAYGRESLQETHTSIVITLCEPCVSERVYVNITTMGNKFLLTTRVKTNKKFCEIINTYLRSNFILKSLVIIKTNQSLNGDFERGFELDLHDLAGKIWASQWHHSQHIHFTIFSNRHLIWIQLCNQNPKTGRTHI